MYAHSDNNISSGNIDNNNNNNVDGKVRGCVYR